MVHLSSSVTSQTFQYSLDHGSCHKQHKKSGDHQLRWVVYPIIYKVLGSSQVVSLGISEPSTVVGRLRGRFAKTFTDMLPGAALAACGMAAAAGVRRAARNQRRNQHANMAGNFEQMLGLKRNYIYNIWITVIINHV